MRKNTLSAELDLLCSSLSKEVLNLSDYQSLSTTDLNRISSFLIQYNSDFSSSKESLNKSLQNWFQGKNTPSAGKLEEISKSLGYAGYPDFLKQHQSTLKVKALKAQFYLNPFQRTLLFCGLVLMIALLFPILTGITIEPTNSKAIEGSELLASVIQAVVVALFYFITRFTDFGGRSQIEKNDAKRPGVVDRSLKQFFSGWKYLWLSFTFLYFWFCILYGLGIYTSAYAQSISDIITILSSFCFAFLFSIMDVKSIPRDKEDRAIDTFYNYLRTFVIGLSVATVLSILDRYYDLGFLDGMGTYLLGYANVIVMLYFFGRLESHYLNVNRFVLLPLYTYAIIQIAYVIFFEAKSGEPSFEASIIGMALILKGFLYFLIREWIKDGKMEHYFLKQHQRKAEE